MSENSGLPQDGQKQDPRQPSGGFGNGLPPSSHNNMSRSKGTTLRRRRSVGGGTSSQERFSFRKSPVLTTEEHESALDVTALSAQSIHELTDFAHSMGIENAGNAKRQDLLFFIIEEKIRSGGHVIVIGVLEILQDGYGFIRSSRCNYLPGPDDIYVSPAQVRHFGLRNGDSITGQIRAPKEGDRFFALLRVDSINGYGVDEMDRRPVFDNLTPVYPNYRIMMEHAQAKYSTRIIDLFCPVGLGQRGLIVAPPRTGKTVMLQEIANAISTNVPSAHLIVLLIAERPEEVTDMRRSVRGEVISSTFDEMESRHVQVSEMVLEKAKRLVESGIDVVILLDSITRLARAHNQVVPTSGKILSGGVDSNALHKPRRFFGAARNIEEGGSLTILATALVDTGSRMDEVIFEEFKGTGNMEIHLDRSLAEKRLFPAIDLKKSGTRKEELLLTEEERQKIWVMRRVFDTLSNAEVGELLLDRMSKTKNNSVFLRSMQTTSS